MLRAVRGVGELRDPAAFRSWLVAIAIRQVRDSYRDRLAQPPAVEFDVPSPDFADQTIERLGLSGQRLQTAEATRWLDDEDRPVLALWWQEAAGELTRAELAAALGLTPAHAAVRVARMKERLVTSRMVVRALRPVPPCGGLARSSRPDWDGEPSPLWRKRLARHVRDCPWCLAAPGRLIPAERLLGGLPLRAGAGRGWPGGRSAGWPGGEPAARADRRGARGAAACGRRHARHARLLSKARPSPCSPSSSRCRSRWRPARRAGRSRSRTCTSAAPAALSVDQARPRLPRARGARRPLPRSARPQPKPQPEAGAEAHAAAGDPDQRAQGRQHLELHRREPGARRLRRVLVLQLGAPPRTASPPRPASSFVPMIWGAANVTAATLARSAARATSCSASTSPTWAASRT